MREAKRNDLDLKVGGRPRPRPADIISGITPLLVTVCGAADVLSIIPTVVIVLLLAAAAAGVAVTEPADVDDPPRPRPPRWPRPRQRPLPRPLTGLSLLSSDESDSR